MISITLLLFTGHAECVRFVKKFNLPLLVSVKATYGFPFSSLCFQWLIIFLIAGDRRRRIHKRKCSPLLDC